MKLLNGRLHLEFSDAIQCGMDDNYLRKAKSTGNKSWRFIDDPDDLRKVLIDYEFLKPQYKEKVQQRFGNPYEYLAKEPIKKMVTKDLEAEKYYMQYRFDGGKVLPIERVNEYTTAASWLNMLSKADGNKKQIKQLLNLPILEFFKKVFEIFTTDNISLPCSYKRLTEKIKAYKEEGYACLVNKQFGNSNAKKVNTEVAEATLLEMIADPRQWDDVMICSQYNQWATANEHAQITPATVGNYRRKNLSSVIITREGSGAFNEKFIRQVKGLKPSTPLALVEHDDNNLDFLFSDANGYEFEKYVAVVVVDSRTNLVLGYSYINSRSPKIEQVYDAYISAMYYIRSLTGGWHLPFELKADKWASKTLTPFYNKIATFIPPSHGNKHRGYIEQFFGSPLWKRCQKFVSQNNWSGNNITAGNRGVNMEALNANAKSRPTIGIQAEQQIEGFFHLLRHMPDVKRIDMQAPSKEQQFLQEWDKLSDADKRPITDEQFLLTFGIKHSHSNTITNRGIEPQIRNIHYSYDLPEQWMYNKLIGEEVEIYYDPFDFSRVLCTNHKDIRFVAQSAQLQPRALKDAHTGSRTYLNAIIAEKKQQVVDVSEASEKRKRITTTNNHFNAEAMLQGGVMLKDQKNDAEVKLLEQFNEAYENHLDENDYSEFFDNPKTKTA